MAYKNKEDKAAYNKKWAAENADKKAAHNKKYNDANKKKTAAHAKIYRAENKEKLAEIDKLYRAANPLKEKEKDLRRRANKKGNGIFTISKRFMRNLYNSPCVSCGASERIEADHLIPIVKGGRHSEGNLQPLCKSCNSSKGPKLWIEFVAEKKGSQRKLMV